MAKDQYVPNDPKTFVTRGFMSGRPLDIAGVRAMLRPTRKGDSARVGIQFFFTEVDRGTGDRKIRTGYMHDGAWSDQMKPAESRKGLVPESGAERPFVESKSPLGLFNASLTKAGCPRELMNGDYTKLVGLKVILEDFTLPSFGRKKSVDPDEAPAPQKEFKTEVVGKIVSFRDDNEGFEPLTEKEMTEYLKAQEAEREARRVAKEAPAAESTEDEEEKPKVKKGKKVEEEEEESDSFEDSDEDEEEEAASEEAEEEEEEEEDPAKALAEEVVLKVLKKAKKVKGGPDLLEKVLPELSGKPKKIRDGVLKLVNSPKFLASVDGVTVKGSMVTLG